MASPTPGLTRVALGVLCFATFVSVTQAAMSSIVLPDLRDEFGVTDDELTWFVTAYILTFAAGTVVYGRLGDIHGTRRPMLIGMTLFAVAAYATAAAPEFWPIVAGRAVMGMGATAVPALSIATIVLATSGRDRGRALGAIVAMVGIGFAAGPLLGAWLTDAWGWRGPMVATGVGSTVVLGAAVAFVPNIRGSGERGLDYIGGALLSLGILSGVTALNRLPTDQSDPLGLAGLVLCLPFLAAFAWWISGRRQPFLDPKVITQGRYLAFCTAGGMLQGAHFGAFVLLPLLWARYHDLTFTEIGLHMIPGAVALAIFGITGGFIIERLGVRIPLIVGTWAASNGVIALAVAGVSWGHWEIAGLYVVVASGYGLANAVLLHGATESLEEGAEGVGVGFYTLLFFLGGAVSSAAVGAVLRAREGTLTAWLPMFDGRAPEFSDAFAVVAVMAAVSFLLAIGLGPSPERDEEERLATSDDFPLREAAGAQWLTRRQKPIRDR